MKLRKLARLEVAPIGMGSSDTFDVVSHEDISIRHKIIDTCIKEGVSFIDTSPTYGHAEKVLGTTMEGRKERFQLATKVWCFDEDAGRSQIANSFKLLKTEYIEVLQIHNLLSWQSHLPYLEELKAQGKIGLIGITHFDPHALPEMLKIMGTRRIDTIQIPYNMMERTVEKEVLPLAQELGIGVIMMLPIGKGQLVRGLKREPNLSPLHELGIHTWVQAILAWLLADPRVSVLIPATTKPERITDNAAVGSLPPLPKELRDYIAWEAQRCLTP